MKWNDKKEELEKFINIEKLSYEEIGRHYGCSGNNIKKVAYRLGIEIPKRRVVNPKETFNRGKAKMGICKNCGKEFILYQGTNGMYCCHECQMEKQYKDWIERWKNGEEDGLVGKYAMSKRIRRYIFEKYNNRCQLCGWDKVNGYTGNIPLQVHHIDGNCLNNSEDNLQLLCPNCHSLTENYGSRNVYATEGRSKYYGKGRRRRTGSGSITDSTIAP